MNHLETCEIGICDVACEIALLQRYRSERNYYRDKYFEEQSRAVEAEAELQRIKNLMIESLDEVLLGLRIL